MAVLFRYFKLLIHKIYSKMKNLEINIQDECAKIHHQYGMSEMANYRIEQLFDKKLKEKMRWIPVNEEGPICVLEDEGIQCSKYLEIKVKGYEHPFIGFYVKANDDQFFDFIHKSVDEGIKQEEVTHYRFVVEA